MLHLYEITTRPGPQSIEILPRVDRIAARIIKETPQRVTLETRAGLKITKAKRNVRDLGPWTPLLSPVKEPPIPPDVEGQFQALEKGLRAFDWYYERSDDGRVWRAGEANRARLTDLIRLCLIHDQERTAGLVADAVPSAGRHGEWAAREVNKTRERRGN